MVRSRFEVRQEEYLNKIRQSLNKAEEIVIYGAGNIGKSLFKLLKDNGINVQAFCVTEAKSNLEEIYGVPVCSLKKTVRNNSINKLFILGAIPPNNIEMIEMLRMYGITNYIDAERDMRHIFDVVSNRPTLEITSRIGCSVNCKLCPQSVLLNIYDVRKRASVLSFETFKRCLDKTPKNLIVDFAGFAEPFLNPDIISMMEYAIRSNRDVRLFTTLVGMTEAVFSKMIKLPFYRVVLHLPDEHSYSQIPLTKEYYSFLERIISARKPNGSRFVDKANSQSKPHYSVLPYIENKTIVHQVLVDWAGNIKSDEVHSSPVKHGKLICDYSVDLNHNILLPDGTVVLCCMDWKNSCVLGNLLVDSYEDIVYGDRKKAICNELNSSIGNEGFICRRCTNSIEME